MDNQTLLLQLRAIQDLVLVMQTEIIADAQQEQEEIERRNRLGLPLE